MNTQLIADALEAPINKLKALKSESFNRTVIMDKTTENTLKRLIREKFDSIPRKEYWRYLECEELIKTALNLGFTEEAAQMTNDNF